jgi:FtsP/CotA-like multicopper oxidase with cupredoxin domain
MEVGEPEMSRPRTLGRIESAAVILDAENRLVFLDPEGDGRFPGAAMPGGIAQGLPGDLEELMDALLGETALDRVDVGEIELDGEATSGRELGDHRFEGPGERLVRCATEPDDECPDVPDGHMQPVDRAVDAGNRFHSIVLHQLWDVLEGEPDRVDALDDPVVEVAADAQPLIDHRELLDALVEPGILNGDPGMDSEHLDELLVAGAELVGVLLFGEIEVADRPPGEANRDPQERVHRWMVGREAVGVRVGPDVGNPERDTLPDDRAEKAVAAWQRSDPGPLLRRYAARDEPLDPAAGVDDAEGGVLGLDELSHAVDHELQDAVEIQLAGDRPGRLVEGSEPGVRAGNVGLRFRERVLGSIDGHAREPTSAAGGLDGPAISCRRSLRTSSSPADHHVMRTQPPLPTPESAPSVSRRGILRGAVLAGGGMLAATVAACTPAARTPIWTYGPVAGVPSGSQPPLEPAASPGASHDHAPGPSGSPGFESHDDAALAVVKRFLGGEYGQVDGAGGQAYGNPKVVGDTKVFELTIEKIQHRIDAKKDPVAALGYNAMWPGPRIDVIEGDKVRAIFTNTLDESTGVHFHGQRIPNNMDGVPHVTQDPILPGASFTYEFTARTVGSHMYHSHHNATDQVGRGLLGAFIVHPKDDSKRVDRRYGVSQDIVWISNDSLGGFTINGRGFPATAPIVAKQGDKILVRFMNEGNMMHPWHLHGMPMHVVARDGYDLGSASFFCDTLGVNPGERWDVVIDCQDVGAWAFHCHILQHAEGQDGMFGMVTALVIQDAVTAALESKTGSSAVVAAAYSAGSTALTCRIG